MDIQVVQVKDKDQWNEGLVRGLPGELLQSWQWGDLKEKYGWQAHRLLWVKGDGIPQAAAQILLRAVRIGPFSPGWTIAYVPRGPLMPWEDQVLRSQVLKELLEIARERKAIFVKVDPFLPMERGAEDSLQRCSTGLEVMTLLGQQGWRESPEQVQFRNTMRLDLTREEEDLLMDMKSKTRYNIRLAGRKGVSVERGGIEHIDLMYRMYAETSIRDGFVIRDQAYYQDAWGSFIEEGLAAPFIARVDGEPVAGLIAYQFGDTAWYLYGMSRDLHREKMPNYLLQWEAIRWAKESGCKVYDFWGAPDRLVESDPMWGVYRFKSGFGADFIRSIGAWDYPLRPRLYAGYQTVLPKILNLMRARGRASTARSLE